MKTLLIILIALLSYSYSTFSQSKNDSIPTEFDCYRFAIDTVRHYSDITYETIYDTASNVEYYKISQSYTIKDWKKYYGYTKVWWIDFTDRKWKNRWLIGYYYKYTEKYKYYEILYTNPVDKEKSIKLLKQQLEK